MSLHARKVIEVTGELTVGQMRNIASQFPVMTISKDYERGGHRWRRTEGFDSAGKLVRWEERYLEPIPKPRISLLARLSRWLDKLAFG